MITDNVLQFEIMLNICLILLVVCLSMYIVVQGRKLQRCEARIEEMRCVARRHREAEKNREREQLRNDSIAA